MNKGIAVVYVACPPASSQLMRRYRLQAMRETFLLGQIPVCATLMYEKVQNRAPTALMAAERLVMSRCDRLVVFADHGITSDMSYLMKMAALAKQPTEFRYLHKRTRLKETPESGEDNPDGGAGSGGDLEVSGGGTGVDLLRP